MHASTNCHTDDMNPRAPSGGFAQRLFAAAVKIPQRLRDRSGLRQLQSLDDHQLKDIGLGRGDVERELSRNRLWR
jgi:uncharacterized protein YjiS (DUF1127 family)